MNAKKAGKFWWTYDETTGLVRSEGSFALRPTKPFCWWVQKPESMWSQRLKIKACDESDAQQKFKFDNGRIFLEAYPRICVGHEVDTNGQTQQVAMTLIKCYANNFANVRNVEIWVISAFFECGSINS